MPEGDAGCSVSTTGGGSPTGPGTGDASDGGVVDSASGCGIADSLLAPPNPAACEVCIQGSCCNSDFFCTGGCETLVSCVVGCATDPSTESACIGNNCATLNVSQAAFNAFNDFATCVNTCGGMCPALMAVTPADF